MTSLRPFTAVDLLNCNPINLDVLTENYHLDYYLDYLCTWPSMFFQVASHRPVGYMIGKSEGRGAEWHSHITALTVDYLNRRLGLGRLLVDQLRISSDAPDQRCFFMDLFVRTSNNVAVDMYKRFGFRTFRRVLNYYGSGKNEDAFDMRMPLERDPSKASLQRSSHTEESSYYMYRYDPPALK